MKKTIKIKLQTVVASFIIAGAGLTYLTLGGFNIVGSATDSDSIQVSTTVDSTISLNSPSDLNLGTITGTGDTGTGHSVTWTVVTNNSAGYTISWLAEETNGGTNGEMESGDDAISAYTPATTDTPEAWSVASTDSEWGGHLGITGLDCTASGITGSWGTDDTTGSNWLNVHHSAAQEICSSTTETDSSGDDIPIHFRAEVGANKLQPSGTYTVNVTVTATTQ